MLRANPPESRSGTPVAIPELTGARGFAALSVFLLHLLSHLQAPERPFPPVGEAAYLAVDFFFVLSGFVLAHVYRDSWLAGTYRHRDFLVRRFARIWPMHIVALL